MMMLSDAAAFPKSNMRDQVPEFCVDANQTENDRPVLPVANEGIVTNDTGTKSAYEASPFPYEPVDANSCPFNAAPPVPKFGTTAPYCKLPSNVYSSTKP